ncbi:MarR family winged helix-turn-helix transcriptional regulator [Streptomyces sp. NPDC058335]|uniref:MarR family winged helix-turn-helix transcriptional regulator n=1 Tax=Streptomyces sp. NPDC058335 TaxID=3346451 RepID=UPI0036698C2B
MAAEPMSSDTDLMFLLSWCSHALATEHTAALAGLGITPRSYCVLYKAMEGELTQSQLAEAGGLDKSTMVLTMDELEKKELAERKASTRDRRARIISVTEKGKQVVAEATAIVTKVNDEILGTLPFELRQPLVSALTQLVEGRLASLPDCERPPRRRATRSR